MEYGKLQFSGKAFESIDRFLNRSPKNVLAVGVIFKDKSWGCYFSEGISSQTRFDIGSISKTFTAQLILKLVNQGKISLDASVDRYLPLPKGVYPSIRNLLTHTAGYGHLTPWEITLPALLTKRYTRANPYRWADGNAVIRALSRRNRFKDHGTYGYSDFAYGVLAVVAERVTGEPFHALLTQLIREDYGLDHTEAYPTAPRCPVFAGNREIEPWHWDKTNPYIAGGGVVSTLEDMLQYAKIQIESHLPQVLQGQQLYEPSLSAQQRVLSRKRSRQ